MAHQLTLKPGVGEYLWKQLNLAWVVFFLIMGILNLIVAYQYDEATWVNFKLFGGMGLMLAFVIAQGVWLNKFIVNDHK
jgi:intracellular septation protein